MAMVCLELGVGRMGEGRPLERKELENRPLLPDRLVQAPFPQVFVFRE